MMADQAPCEFIDGDAGRGTVGKEGKSMSRICVYSSEGKYLLPPWWKKSSVIDLPSGYVLSAWEMMLYRALNSDLCYWQIRCSAVELTRSALLRGSSCC